MYYVLFNLQEKSHTSSQFPSRGNGELVSGTASASPTSSEDSWAVRLPRKASAALLERFCPFVLDGIFVREFKGAGARPRSAFSALAGVDGSETTVGRTELGSFRIFDRDWGCGMRV